MNVIRPRSLHLAHVLNAPCVNTLHCKCAVYHLKCMLSAFTAILLLLHWSYTGCRGEHDLQYYKKITKMLPFIGIQSSWPWGGHAVDICKTNWNTNIPMPMHQCTNKGRTDKFTRRRHSPPGSQEKSLF